MKFVARKRCHDDDDRQRDDQTQMRQQPAEEQHRTDDEAERLPGERADRVAIGALDAQCLEQDDEAEQRRQQPEPERKEARAGMGRIAEAIGGRAPGESKARRDEHQTGPEVALTLDFHPCFP